VGAEELDVVNPSTHYYCLPKHLPEKASQQPKKAPQRPQKHVARESVSKPVARLLHPLQSSAYGQLASSPKPLAHGRLYVSVSNDPVHQSRSILHSILRIRIVFECYSTILLYQPIISYHLTMHLSTALLMVLAFGGTQAFQLSFLVPPNKPVAKGKSSCRLDSTPKANENHHAATMTNDRRAFVLSSLVAATSLTVNLNFPAPAQATDSVDYKAVSRDIASMIKKDPNRGPTLVRLA
jgi:hypothetical protein